MAQGHIFIGIPTSGQMVSTATTKSLYRLSLALQRGDVKTTLFFAESADIIENRNILAAYFLESEASHLLSIDSDIGFEPQLIGDFLKLKKPFMGAAYPKRKIDMHLFGEAYAALGSIEDPDERFRAAKARASQFPFVAKPGARVRNGFAQANGIPAGLMLTERRVFTEMMENAEKAGLKKLGATPLWPKGGHFGFFDRVWVEEKKYWLSEDLSFCNRWVKGLGQEIHAYLGPGVVHHGAMPYDATYLDFAKNRAAIDAANIREPDRAADPRHTAAAKNTGKRSISAESSRVTVTKKESAETTSKETAKKSAKKTSKKAGKRA